MPQGYAASYDTVVLEVEEIEKSPSGSARDMNQDDSFLSPDELCTIKVADLVGLVKSEYDSRYQERAGQYSNKYAQDENFKTKIDQEITGDLVGDILFSDEGFIKHLTKDKGVFQTVWDEVKYYAKMATPGSAQSKLFEKTKRAFEKAYREMVKGNKSTGETKLSLNIKHTDGTVEELADARDLTDEQAVGYLYQAKSGELRGETYIPVRKDTPQVIIDTLEQVNENVNNLSLVMQVRKAQQAMSSENPGKQSGKHGSNVRKHTLSPEQIVEIINNLDDPSTVIYQTNRQDKNGNPLPNNVAVFVEYNSDGTEGVAVIEFESSFDSEAVGTEYGDTSYHTVVTVFTPDTVRDDMPFDYAEELLSNPNNTELEIKRRQSDESATREKHPNTSKELPSSDATVAQEEGIVNGKFSVSDSTGKQLSKGQQEYFKDSKMRDENGNLKVMYHGSQDAGFHVFDSRMSDDDTSFFFVDRNDVAQSYSGSSEVYEARTIRSAEDMNNFLAEIGEEDYKVVEENGNQLTVKFWYSVDIVFRSFMYA